jgi:uncharacterized protein
MKRPAFLVLLISAAALRAQAQVGATATAPEIVNVGHGEVRLRPDRVSLTIGVVTHGKSAAVAGALNAQRVTPLLAALRRQGLADSVIATTGYNVNAEYSEPGRPLPDSDAYVARNAVQVTLARINELGRILDTALASGATEVSRITFESSQIAIGRQRAIALAIEAARTDATAAASAAGGRLGPIIEITIDPGTFMPRNTLSEVIVSSPGTGGAETPMLPSDLTVAVQARVRFSLIRRR